MEGTFLQQEILLMTNSKFASKNWSENTSEDGQNKSQDDSLKEACWNGLLPSMLPEIWPGTDNKIFLWEVSEAHSFISIMLSQAPAEVAESSSVNPYLFLKELLLS